MRLMFGWLLVVCAAGGALATEPLDDLFARWVAAEGKAESLVVKFDLETKDPIFDQRDKASGTFRLIRTKNGEVFASYEVVAEKPKGEGAEQFSGLLNGGKVYLLNHDKKTAMRFELADSELKPFLEKYFNPFVVLLDRKRAEAKCTLEVVKQDEWYTYLAVKPKPVKRYGWFPNNFHDGRLVLMRKDAEAVPKGMPRQLWYTDGVREYLFDIKAWQLNPAAGPKLEEFAKPEDRPGWEVVDWPFQRKK
jgi:hypothetical protein